MKERSPANSGGFIDVVFDLDWTLVSLVEKGGGEGQNSVRVRHEVYRVNDYARELVTYLNSLEGVRVSFYSGGPEERNLPLLKNIKLLDGSGKSFYDVAHKIVSRDEMIEVDVSHIPNATNADRWRKNLLKIKGSLENLIMVEDDIRHALDDVQKSHTAWLGMSFRHFESFDLLVRDPKDQFLPGSKSQWVFHRNKLGILSGIIDEVIESGEKDFHKGVMKRLSKVNFQKNRMNAYGKYYLDRGESSLGKYKPSSQRISFDDNCFNLINLFLP